jgi:hypothetical protein
VNFKLMTRFKLMYFTSVTYATSSSMNKTLTIKPNCESIFFKNYFNFKEQKLLNFLGGIEF